MAALRAHRVRLLLGAVAVLGVSPALAGPFSDLVVFGDSLSDVGNVSQTSPFSLVPGRYYYNGRFSNGPIYAEALAAGLGLAPLTSNLAGGDDFAYGGAKTSGSSNYVMAVSDQVTYFLDHRVVDPNALFVVLAGANDLLEGETDVSVPVGQLTSDISRLVDAGARQFLSLNLPLLGMTPRYNSSPSAATFNDLSNLFNAALADGLDGLEAGHPDLTVFRLDVADLISNVAAFPVSFGLANVTDPAAPGLSPGALFYNKSQIVSDPNSYLFWDDLHPTTAGHAMLAEQALLALRLPGDYNGDGTVDAADYTVWRDAAGQIGPDLAADGDANGVVNGADYNLWREHFGVVGGGGSLVNGTTSVPEPSTLVLAVLAVAAAAGSRKNKKRCPTFVGHL